MDQHAFEAAIRSLWLVREAQAARQAASGLVDAGRRGAVTGGGHLDGLVDVFAGLFVAAGFPPESVRRSRGLELPGYYRPTKRWDLVVVDGGVLVAAIEFKSQVGPSFGNNVNNRTEEAIGSAVDVWHAYQHGTFGTVRPWLGYVFLLERAPASTRPVGLGNSAFGVDPVFTGTSYADRYRILCQRLVRERLYDAACFVTSSANPSEPVDEPDPELSFSTFVAAVAGRIAYIKALAA
jgi:hypothetical protein